MSDASSGGGYGRPPKPRRVDRTPPGRRDVGVAIGTVVGRAKPPPPPKTWTRPVQPVRVAAPKPRRLTPTIGPNPRQAAQAEARRARQKALEQKVGRARAQVQHQTGTFIGPERPRVDLHDAIPPPVLRPPPRGMSIGNNAGLAARGIRVTPINTVRALQTLFRPGPHGKQHALEYLHEAGVVDPRGTTTHREKAADQRVRRDRVIAQAWALQNLQNHNNANTAVGIREFRSRIGKIPTAEIERRIAVLSQPQNLQKMGFDPSQLGGLIQGTASGLSDLANKVTPDSFAGRAAHDLLMWPTWAVPAAYEAANNPGEFVKGLSQGVIGNVARGDLEGAKEAFNAHPLFSLAEVRGGAALGGRLAAGSARGIAQLTGNAGRVLPTGRAPINLTGLVGSRAVQERSGTKSLALPRARQRLVDAVLTKPGPQVERATGMADARVYRTDLPLGIGRALDEVRKHQVRRHQDYSSSRGINYEQLVREEAARGAANARLPEGRIASALMRVLDVPGRPTTGAAYHGALGKIAAKVAPRLATDPVAGLVSFVGRGVIRRVVTDAEGNVIGRASAKTVREDIDHIITDLRERLDPRNEGAIRSKPEHAEAQGMIDFLTEIRDSRGALEEVHRIAERIAPEFARNDRELGRLGALDAEAAARAPLFPGAMTVLDAAYSDVPYRNERGAIKAEYGERVAQAREVANDASRERVKAENAHRRAQDEFQRAAGMAEQLSHRVSGERGAQRTRAAIRQGDIPVAGGQRLAEAARKVQATAGRVRAAREAERAAHDAVEGIHSLRQDRLAAHFRPASQRAVLHGPSGERFTNEQINAGLKRAGIEPAEIFHVPANPFGGGAYHKQQSLSRRNADTHSTTGKMWQQGEAAYSWDHVVDSLVHGRTLAANIQSLDQAIHDVGTRVKNGSWEQTVKWAKEKGKDSDGNPRWVVVRRMSSKLDADRREVINDLQTPIRTDEKLSETALADRTKPPAKDGPDVAVVVPFEWYQRAEQNIKRGSSVAAFQALSSGFRQTVLPFSTKWLFGNVAEAVIRTLAVTANPLDRGVARKTLDRMIAEDALALHGKNPEVRAKANALLKAQRIKHPVDTRRLRRELYEFAPRARAAEAELTGGLLYGHRGQAVRRTSKEMGAVGKGVAFVGRAPVVNEFAAMTRWIARKSFAINRVLEREAQYVTLGKHVRNEIQEFSGRWQSGIKLYEKGVEEVSRGLLGTPSQVKAAKWMDETLGRYSRFSPNTRWVIQNAMPFLPWYLNAVRWTMITLPGKHPIKTALLTSAERTFEQDWNNKHNDKLLRHGELATYPVAKDGGLVPLTHYTPLSLMGTILGGADPGDIPGLLLPQFQGASNALRGMDPFGSPLVISKKYGGTGEKLEGGDLWKVAANQFLESIIPGLSIGRRLQEHGETPLPTSTFFHPKTKPGTAYGRSALGRVFVPWSKTYLRPPNGNDSSMVHLPPGRRAIIERARAHAAERGPVAISPGRQAIIDRARALAGG